MTQWISSKPYSLPSAIGCTGPHGDSYRAGCWRKTIEHDAGDGCDKAGRAGRTQPLAGVTGEIAAYKSCSIVTALRKRGASVCVVMTVSATCFVSLEAILIAERYRLHRTAWRQLHRTDCWRRTTEHDAGDGYDKAGRAGRTQHPAERHRWDRGLQEL
ncbi:MAG: hypothetical protein GX358_05830 [candidate division WS1 bacterium]|nr:hypothetical protein [candidate division WS1 bacterium]